VNSAGKLDSPHGIVPPGGPRTRCRRKKWRDYRAQTAEKTVRVQRAQAVKEKLKDEGKVKWRGTCQCAAKNQARPPFSFT